MLAERFKQTRRDGRLRYEWPSEHEKVTHFEEIFTEWQKGLRGFEETARRKLYENDEFDDLDRRFHRAALGGMIYDGEGLAIEAIRLLHNELIDQESFEAHVKVIDELLAVLTARLHEWHGALEDQVDVPQSFKKGIKDIAEGKVLDMEKAMQDDPPSGDDEEFQGVG